MNRKTSRLLAAICMVMCLMSLCVPQVLAASSTVVTTQTDIAPRMTYIKTADCQLTVSGGAATVDAFVTGNSGTATKCRVSVTLQQQSGTGWSTIKTWVDEQSGRRASVSESESVTKGKSYRAVATVTVWSGSQSESKTITSGTHKA